MHASLWSVNLPLRNICFANMWIHFSRQVPVDGNYLDSEQTGESSVKFNCQKYAIKTDTMVFSLAMFKLGIPK